MKKGLEVLSMSLFLCCGELVGGYQPAIMILFSLSLLSKPFRGTYYEPGRDV